LRKLLCLRFFQKAKLKSDVVDGKNNTMTPPVFQSRKGMVSIAAQIRPGGNCLPLCRVNFMTPARKKPE
jgi:hypothetical protein